jgi:phosphoserine phosphatase
MWIFLFKNNMFRRNRRLVCFDMDSTLIQTEVIDELADLAGGGTSTAITEAAMNGEIDFKESFKQAHGFARRFKRRGIADGG